jgi:hypothetical protein
MKSTGGDVSQGELGKERGRGRAGKGEREKERREENM